MEQEITRRPLETRSKAWPRKLAFGLVRLGVEPNQISVVSIVFASLAGALLLGFSSFSRLGQCAALFGVAVCIQLRLLCNMLDGLMAVEGNRKSKTGEIYNELPDRFADVFILASVGYAIPYTSGIELGWIAAVLAILTAYIRALGGTLGLKQDFCGPMAKPHRMFALTVGSLVSIGEILLRNSSATLWVTLWVIVLGSAYTALRRTLRISKSLKER